MERLDSLSNKKPALKFKPKVVARKSQQDRTQTIKTPTEAKPKRADIRKQKPRVKNQQHSSNDNVISVGPLAQGAISLGNNQRYQASPYHGAGFVKREPGVDFTDDGVDDNGLIDINNPSITDELFPHKPPRDGSSPVIEETVSVDEDSKLQDDYSIIKNMLLSRDTDGDVKMEDDQQQQQQQPPQQQLNFLQLPKLPIDSTSEGLIGRINVHESGRVSLQIGEIQFDLSIGGELNSNESVWVLNPSNEVCYNIGDIKNRIIGTPNF